MNILILANKPPYPPKDGGSIATFNLAAGLAILGHKIHILTYNTSKHQIDPNTLPQFENLEITHVDLNTSISPIRLLANFIFSKKPYNAQRFESQAYLNALENLLKINIFDVVQMEGPYLWFCEPTIRKFSNIKIALRAHNIEHEIWQRSAEAESNIFKKIYLKNLAKRISHFEHTLVNKYDLLLPITKRDGAQFEAMGNLKPLHIVPVGLKVNEIPYQISENKGSLFYIGALDWVPNQEGLLWFIDNVWPVILEKQPKTIFHIAGRNAPEWLRKRLTKNNVQYHGEVANAYAFMQYSGIMVVPLFSGSGMRVKIIEGLAMGKAIVSTSIGAEGIEIDDGKNILISNNAADFGEKVCLLITNSERAKLISENAHNCAIEKYNNDRISEELAHFYSSHLNLHEI